MICSFRNSRSWLIRTKQRFHRLRKSREPRDRRHVEVVRRLVEQQHVGALEQQAREHAAHLPAARELAEVARLVAGREAEAGEDRERLVLAEEPLEVIDPLVQLADLAGELEQRLLVGAVAASPASSSASARGEPRVELGAARHARQDHVDQRAAARDRDVLRQPADAHAVRARDLAVVDLLLAGDDLEQRRLARAVRADQADPIAVAEAQRRRVEDHPIGEEQRDFVEDDQTHGGAWIAQTAPVSRAATTARRRMTYRDDRDADRARIAALEAELATAKRRVDELEGTPRPRARRTRAAAR